MPIISGERDFASVKVKSCGGRCQAAIRDSRSEPPAPPRPTQPPTPTPTPTHARAVRRRAAPRHRPDGQPEAVHHSLYVWTDRGVWYSYRLNALKGGDCVLQDEQRLLPAAC